MSGSGGFALFIVTLLIAVALQMVALPAAVAAIRPEWVALTLVYWALSASDKPILVAAWITGLVLDVLFDSLLGEHAFALLAATFLVRRLRDTLVLYPFWQVSLSLVPVWALYTFILFWIDGLTHHSAASDLRWMPMASTAVLWPIAAGLLDRLLTPSQPHRLT